MQFRDLKKQYEVLKQDIDKNIAEVLKSAAFISGPQVAELEKQLAEMKALMEQMLASKTISGVESADSEVIEKPQKKTPGRPRKTT